MSGSRFRVSQINVRLCFISAGSNQQNPLIFCPGLVEDDPVEKSQFWRVFQQLDHAFEQTTGAAAVDAAMVKA
jgi:hypothetical protein